MNQTISYYNEHAEEYIADTQDVNFHRVQDHFLSLIPRCGRILDFGCGSGRDVKYFRNKGFRAEGIDASDEMCYRASRYTGTNVRKMLFTDLNDIQSFDGIWACASLLHLNDSDLANVLYKISAALVDGGIVYASFQYGEGEEMREGRFYNDMTERKFRNILQAAPDLVREESWISSDVKENLKNVRWLNLILRKHDSTEEEPVINAPGADLHASIPDYLY